MSKKLLKRFKKQFGAKVLETSDQFGDETALVDPKIWVEAATYLRDDDKFEMKHFTDLTAVDYPEREPDEPRFEVILAVRSLSTNKRMRIKTRVEDGKSLPSLKPVYAGADWAEREVFDMFGITFEDHGDLRRILMYEEFEGYPLRKDYPIDRAQPLVPYRNVPGITKLPPFGIEEGQPWGRVDWSGRLDDGDAPVSRAKHRYSGNKTSANQESE